MELNRANSYPNGIAGEPIVSIEGRLHLQSMASTNINSGSERSQETKELINDFKARISPKGRSAAHKLKKEASILHPSSPSKIQIDSIDVRVVSKRLSEPSSSTESDVQKHVPPPSVTVQDILKKVWQEHKQTVYGALKTFLVLFIFLLVKRALQRLLPLAWQRKIRKFLL